MTDGIGSSPPVCNLVGRGEAALVWPYVDAATACPGAELRPAGETPPLAGVVGRTGDTGLTAVAALMGIETSFRTGIFALLDSRAGGSFEIQFHDLVAFP